MKDNFSLQSGNYALYRPAYPSAFFEYLKLLLPNTRNTWDCGTGNGQVAFELSKIFEQVYATDISQSQMDHALQAKNINYSVKSAESADFSDNFFDLIIVAQAIHWFDFEKFYVQVRRTATSNALICAIGYGRIVVSPEIDNIINNFYSNVIGKYWDAERRYIDQNYQTIPFPFDEVETPEFENRFHWSLDHLIGYLNTWSAVKHFITKKGNNPVDSLRFEIENHWKHDEIKEVSFPLLLRLGYINRQAN